MRCSGCGARLPENSNLCRYCGLLNDTDLRSLGFSRTEAPLSERICPRCVEPMRTINLNVQGSFLVERCERCLGIFFDPGELEYLLDTAVSNVHDVDFSRLNTLLEQQQKNDFPVAYVKCPVCLKFMNRKNYGARSGVIVDWCKEHGVWLDGGELGALLKWSKAGGQEHNANRIDEKKRVAEQEKAAREFEERLQSHIDSGDEEGAMFFLLGSVFK